MSFVDLENLTVQVPERIAADPVMAAIYVAQTQAIDQWIGNVWDVLDQVFPLSATHEGLKRLEHEARIQPQDLKDIPRRRAVLVGKIRGEGTITEATVRDIVEAFGYGRVEIRVNASAFLVEITYADKLGVPAFQQDVEAELLCKLPAHLDVKFIVRYLVWDTLDRLKVTWNVLDLKALAWDQFELWEG